MKAMLIAVIVTVSAGFGLGLLVDSQASVDEYAVLIPTNAAEVEACFDLADEIHASRGGELAYDVCSSNDRAYREWREWQSRPSGLVSGGAEPDSYLVA